MIKDLLEQEISEALIKLNIKEASIKSSLSQPKDKLFGDYSSNIAMLLAKDLKKTPREIALILIDNILKNTKLIERAEVAGPGFINFYLNDFALYTIIKNVIETGSNYGKTKQENPKKILIEFVSANPTGGLHLGHARSSFMGDAVARLLKASGFVVTREYYVNDSGNQVETLARTIHKRYRELFGEKIDILPGEYPSLQIKDIAVALKNQDGDKWLNQPEEVWLSPLIKFGVNFNLSLIKNSLEKVFINMDNWFFEHSLHDGAALDELIKAYQKRNMVYDSDKPHGNEEKTRREDSKASKYSHLQAGGLFLKTSLFGDDEDRIVKRRDGRFVYLTADLAYHKNKFERGFDMLIDVLGADHSGHVPRIKAGMEALGLDKEKLNFILVQMVRLLKNGQEVRFSKRAGEVSALDDLIEVIGVDAARFIFLMRSSDTQFDFDIDMVLKNNQENPVFYVQYGHARMATILKKAFDANIKFNPEDFNIKMQAFLVLPEERQLILKVAELPYVIKEAALAFEPHKVIFYCQELIKIFHSYFTKYRHEEKIIGEDENKTHARLSLVYALKQTIHNALNILSISAPEYMQFLEE